MPEVKKLIFKRNSGSYLNWEEYIKTIPKRCCRIVKTFRKPMSRCWHKGEVLPPDLSLEAISRIFSEQLRRLPTEGGGEIRQP